MFLSTDWWGKHETQELRPHELSEMASGLQGAAGKGEVSWNEAGMLQGTVRVGCLPRDLHLNSQKVYAGLTEKKSGVVTGKEKLE